MCLSLPLCMSLSLSLCMCLSLSLCLSPLAAGLPPCHPPPLCMCLFPPLSLSSLASLAPLCMSLSLSLCRSLSLTLCMSLAAGLPPCHPPPLCMSLHSSIWLSISFSLSLSLAERRATRPNGEWGFRHTHTHTHTRTHGHTETHTSTRTSTHTIRFFELISTAVSPSDSECSVDLKISRLGFCFGLGSAVSSARWQEPALPPRPWRLLGPDLDENTFSRVSLGKQLTKKVRAGGIA